jgi:hypothetical protein
MLHDRKCKWLLTHKASSCLVVNKGFHIFTKLQSAAKAGRSLMETALKVSKRESLFDRGARLGVNYDGDFKNRKCDHPPPLENFFFFFF